MFYFYKALGSLNIQDQQEIVVSNPFLKKNQSINSEFDEALEAMQV